MDNEETKTFTAPKPGTYRLPSGEFLGHVMEWINIKDQEPEPWQEVLFYDEGEFCLGVYIGKGIFRYINQFAFDSDCEPTHWMPLPDPPKEK